MKNIYLTSHGIDTRYKSNMNSYSQIIELLKGKNVAIIPNAKLMAQNRMGSLIIMEELKNNYIKGSLFDLDMCLPMELSQYNAIYGGSPKYLMDSIYHNNFFDEIEEFIVSGNITIGQSAGAMIMNKEYCDINNGKLLIQHNGFDLFNKIIIPHYNNLSGNLKSQIPSNTLNINDNDLLIKI